MILGGKLYLAPTLTWVEKAVCYHSWNTAVSHYSSEILYTYQEPWQRENLKLSLLKNHGAHIFSFQVHSIFFLFPDAWEVFCFEFSAGFWLQETINYASNQDGNRKVRRED